MEELSFAETPVLFGANPTPGIVAAELAGRFIRLFLRKPDGVFFHDEPFRPFILLEEPALLDGLTPPAGLTPLAGDAPFRWLAEFADWHDCLAAREFLVKTSGHPPSHPDAPYLFLSDPVHQHLLRSGTTFFKGLPFAQVRRLALDIETLCAEGFEFSNPQRAEDRIASIAVLDSEGFSEVIVGTGRDETAMLERLTAVVRERDPDVIEGHNLFRFDLEYLRVRADRCGVKLHWGRDGSVPRVHPARFTVAERIIDYPRWDIYGRQVIDTYFLLQQYDVGSRDLESYGLKAAARHFGLAAPDRVYLDGNEITRTFREDPERLARYNLDDVRETLALSRLLSYPLFLQARIFPYSYQTCLVRGTATRINALFLREYVRQGKAIPRGRGGEPFEGGYTEVLRTGVVGPVVLCDVASLYPSLILSFGLAPAGDSLGVFLPLLRELREFRLRAKLRAREAVEPGERDYFHSLQQTFKVLINSFYGYLGAPLHNFADVAVAAEVARRGREVLRTLLDRLAARGAVPVEVDTDGIYFIPPAGVTTQEAEEELVATAARDLPAGIEVERVGRYRAMFSYKAKNYALLDETGQVSIKGSGLRSRGMEKYLREFLAELIRLLLTGAGDRGPELLRRYREQLAAHALPIAWLAKTETLSEAPATYQQKVRTGKRNPAAAYEIALRSGHEYRAGDQISYYVTGHGRGVVAHGNCRPVSAYDPEQPDENVAHYLEKLEHLAGKFSHYLPGEPTLFD